MVSSVLIERRALYILGTVVDNPGFGNLLLHTSKGIYF